jgi:phosphate acetyltransferase
MGTRSMHSVENTTYDELKVGASARVTRVVSATEVEALALVSGDIDTFHLDASVNGERAAITAKAAGAEAIVSGLLCRRLPGPGTTVLEQQLKFNGVIARR